MKNNHDRKFKHREMVPHRLASVSETNEENGDGSTEKSASQPLQKNNKTHSTRNSNQLHVTINTTPEEIECDDNGHAGSAIRRPSALAQDILSTRRSSSILAAIRSPKQFVNRIRRESSMTEASLSDLPLNDSAVLSLKKNRRFGDDALSSSLSALYAKIVVIIGIALPVTSMLSERIAPTVYQSFYVYLYIVSILFVMFVYSAHIRTKVVFPIKSYQEDNNNYATKKRTAHFGSFYLRVGAISFGIGSMVYCGLELGQYFESYISFKQSCSESSSIALDALTPIARMLLSIIQMQFIFLNTTDLDMGRHKVVCRFGLMHMIATNLCEWLHVLIEETKHDISHVEEVLEKNKPIVAVIMSDLSNATDMSNINCTQPKIMENLIRDAAPFLFPCTIEYSLICAVILYEMFKNVKSIPNIERQRRNSIKTNMMPHRSAQHFSVDCSRAHRGLFGGILVIVLTIICMIMYFVLREEFSKTAIIEVIYCEILLYSLTALAVLWAVITMRDLKFLRRKNDHHDSTVKMDCTLLIVAQAGVYLYGSFSIIGGFFNAFDNKEGSVEVLISESLCLIQASLQTLFILNASWRKCKGAQQQRNKPGRQMITFLMVANMSMWFIYSIIKSEAVFRPNHSEFFGDKAWTVITHVSMPLAIFYRFHSSICLFEIWRSVYKTKELITN